MFEGLNVSMFVCVFVCLYVCLYVCMFVCLKRRIIKDIVGGVGSVMDCQNKSTLWTFFSGMPFLRNDTFAQNGNFR